MSALPAIESLTQTRTRLNDALSILALIQPSDPRLHEAVRLLNEVERDVWARIKAREKVMESENV